MIKSDLLSPEQLIGVWHLVSATGLFEQGRTTALFGANPIGRLIYDQQGTVSLQITASDVPLFLSGDRQQGTEQEVRTAFENYSGYFGTYEVDVSSAMVIHQIEGGSFPNWRNTKQIRYLKMADGLLYMQTTPIRLRDNAMVAKLVWRRL